MKRPRRIASVYSILAGSLLAAFLALSVLSVRHRTLTYDEALHFRYGRQILELDSRRFDNSKMPISALNALPVKISEYMPQGQLQFVLSKFYTARAVTIVAGALLGILVFLWARQLYGRAASILALALFAFEPNLIAHSGLVTTDVYAAVLIALTVYLFWLYCQRVKLGYALLVGIALGLSLIAKYTSVLLVPLLPIMAVIRSLPKIRRVLRERRFPDLRKQFLRTTGHTALIGSLALLIVNAGFLFRDTFTPLVSYNLRSNLLRSIQRDSPVLANLPLPIPYPYLEGLDWVYHLERTDFEGRKRYYLLGNLSNEGFVGYYAVAFLFKTPLAIQLAFGAASVALLRRRGNAKFSEGEVFLLTPLVLFTLYFNFFNKAQLGLRFFLVAFPYILIFSSRIASDWHALPFRGRVGILGLVLYLGASVLSYFPHYISYVNELVPNRDLAYRVLADSNIDWGQSGWYVQQYVQQHPGSIVDPPQPTSGLILVGVNNFVGITVSPARYEWLRRCCEPVDSIGYSYLVFEVEPSQLDPDP
jgi:hypothetical protein